MSDEDQVGRFTPEKQLTALLKASNQNHKKRQSLAGEIGERIKAAQENAHLNPKAFALICSLDRMEDLKRRDFLRNFEYYVEVMEKEWGNTEDMVDQAERQARDTEAEEKDHVAKTSEALEKGIKPLDDKKKAKGAGDGDAPGGYKLQ